MKFLLTILFFFLLKPAPDNAPANAIQEGNHFYKTKNWPAAIKSYDKALHSEFKNIATFNKGNALFRLKNYEEAIQNYRTLTMPAKSKVLLQAAAYYNIGVVYTNQQKLEESIEAYKKALRLNWRDAWARDNLQKALSELKKKGGGGGGGGSSNANQQPTPKMNQNQAQQQLKQLEQKERQTSEKVSGQKSQYGGSNGKDW